MMHRIAQNYSDILFKLEELKSNDIAHDRKIELIFEYLKQLKNEKYKDLMQKNRNKIGYKY
jgi:hypothetical protein